jgi:hypothetical protein
VRRPWVLGDGAEKEREREREREKAKSLRKREIKIYIKYGVGAERREFLLIILLVSGSCSSNQASA